MNMVWVVFQGQIETWACNEMPVTLPVEFVSRTRWGASPNSGTRRLKHPIKVVIFTVNTDVRSADHITTLKQFDPCKTVEECCAAMRDMQTYYVQVKGKKDLPYNFVVGGDGRIYEGRGWYIKPLKSKIFPDLIYRALDIAYLGNYENKKKPPRHMWNACMDFCDLAVTERKLAKDFDCAETNVRKSKLYEIRKPKEKTN